jgi:hypothetical protein
MTSSGANWIEYKSPLYGWCLRHRDLHSLYIVKAFGGGYAVADSCGVRQVRFETLEAAMDSNPQYT